MALNIGDVAPDFTLKNENGEDVTLSALRGSNVVLVFFPLAFSPTCTSELQGVTRHAKQYADLNAKVFGISVDSRWTQGAFKRAENLSASLLADFHPKGAVAGRYGVFLDQLGIASRGTFVIDKEGVVRGITITSPKEARNEESYFEALSSCPL